MKTLLEQIKDSACSKPNLKDKFISFDKNIRHLLECDETDLSNYYTQSEINLLLDNKEDKLTSGISIKTINNESLLGSGNIEIDLNNDDIYTKDEIDDKLNSLNSSKITIPMYFRDKGLTLPFELTNILPSVTDGIEVLGQFNNNLLLTYTTINRTTLVEGFEGVFLDFNRDDTFSGNISIRSHNNINNASLKFIIYNKSTQIGEAIVNNINFNNLGDIKGVDFNGVFSNLDEQITIPLSDLNIEILIKGLEFASQEISLELITAYNHVSMFSPKSNSVSLNGSSVYIDGEPLDLIIKELKEKIKELSI